MLEFAPVLAPAFGGGKGEPVTHVRDLGGPALVEFAGPFPPAKAFDDALHLEEFLLRVSGFVRAGQRAFGARPQRHQEIADLRVGVRIGLQLNVAPRIVVDPAQRAIDDFNALANRLPLAIELRLEVGHLANGVFVEQAFECAFEARQVVRFQAIQHLAVLAGGLYAGIGLPGFQRVARAIGLHALDDALFEGANLLVFRIDAALHPFAHFALAVVAAFHRQHVRTQRLEAHGFDARENVRLYFLASAGQ